jgi:ribose transport system ATP-binding protein
LSTDASQPEARTVTSSALPARLTVDGLGMTFGVNRVLRDVAIEVLPGELHGLIGQNGSGKSTLAKVLTGLYSPDAGTDIAVDGTPLRLPVRPQESRAAGVAVVHQSLGLIEHRTVLENLRLGRLKGHGIARRIDWKRERAEAASVFERLGRSVDFDAKVSSLREEDRATVAIARALQDATPGRGLIIFDESTRALSRRSLEHFFTILDEIVATGTSILLITHRLEEIVDAADRVTILRDGRVVESGREVAGMDEGDLTAMMLGRGLVSLGTHVSQATGSVAPLTVENLRGLGVDDVEFDVTPGEVLGLTGIAGSGYDDVPYLLSGASAAQSGALNLSSVKVPLRGLTPSRAIEAGVALVPEGRDNAGLAGNLSVAENAAFPQTSRSRRAVLPFSQSAEKALAKEWIERLDVRPADPKVLVKNLSGGNAQKVLLAKWLATSPELLLLHEPTQAVDVGARHTIVSAVRKAAADGQAVIVAGSDENELSLLCDRILVFKDGRVARELTGQQSPDDIVDAIYAGGARVRLRQNRGEEDRHSEASPQ